MKSHLLIRHLLICLLFILFTYITLPSVTHAQSVPQQLLDVSPIIQDLHLTPGKATTYQLSITNRADKPVGFHLDVTGIDPTADSVQDYSHLMSPFLSWITITPSDLIVAPHDKNTFTVTINTPQNAKVSGYYATLFLTPFVTNPLQNSGPVILQRVGTLLLATVGQTNYNDLLHKVHITHFGFIQQNISAPHAITFTVTNSYFTHFTAKPFLTFLNPLGKTVRTTPEEKHVLPGSSRTWTIPLHTPWYTIYSNATLALSIGNGEQLHAQTIYINYPLVLGVVLSACLIFLVFKRTKQLKKAITMLFAGHE